MNGHDQEQAAVGSREHREFRVFYFNTGLWMNGWEGVARVDSQSVIHIPPGLYQVRVRYLPHQASSRDQITCVALSEPFRVLEESLWQRWID